jgi:hypothetical protein
VKRLVLMLACVAALAGCTAQKELLKEAQTPEETVYALYGSFVVYEEVAADLDTNAQTPADVKDTIRKLDATAKPAADSLQDAARSVIKIKAQVAAGGTSGEKLDVVNANLAAWIAEAKPKITAFICAVNPKDKVCKS